ncbi:glycosyltransferase family 39 protein [Desulfobacterales bacterium HSG2]|nr:glycosyltransferase family 39 protein [Desulfobacterales bacterium HSG2]
MIYCYFKRLKTSKYVEHVCIILLSMLIISVVILSCVPPVSRDALVYHLALPKLYLRHGGMCEIPSLIFSYFPSNLHLLYAIPLCFNNDIIPKFIHFTFALLTAWLIFVYLRKRLGTLYALFGALFFLSIPLIVKLSITAYVDLGLVFFSTASLFYLVRWIENKFRLKYLIISGIWCGLALGTKYNGLMVLFLLTLFVPFVHSRSTGPETQNQYRAIGYGALFMLTALLIFSPWMIRNYAWTQNPIYPLYDNWFNPENPAPAYSILTIMNFELRSVIQEEPWWEIALLPVRIFFQGQDGNPRYFDGKLNPFLFFLPFFAFWQYHKDSPVLITEKKIFIIFSILVLLFVLFTTNMCQLRYTAIMIPPLVILAVFGLHEIRAILPKFPKLRKSLVFIIVLSVAGINAAYIYGQFKYVDPISYITGKTGRDEYIKRYRGEYPAVQFANSNLSENSKILGIFIGDRRYYCDRDMVFDINGLLKTIKEAASPKKIASDLGKKEITHLLIRYDLFNEWRGNNFEGGKAAMLGTFLKEHLTPLFSKGGYGLFRLEKNS